MLDQSKEFPQVHEWVAPLTYFDLLYRNRKVASLSKQQVAIFPIMDRVGAEDLFDNKEFP